MTYTFKCACGHKFDWHNIAMDKRDKFHPPCPECKGTANRRVMPDRFSFAIQETNDPISVKSDSYWNNAEMVRQKKAKKKHDVEQERMYYDEAHRNKKLTGQARAESFNED